MSIALSRTEFLLNKQLLWFANGLVCAHRTNIHYSCMYTSEMLGSGCALLLCVCESFLGWHKNRCSNKNMARLTLSKCIPDLISATKSNDKRWFRFAFAVLIHTCAFPFVCQNSSPFDIVAYQKSPYHFTSAVESVQIFRNTIKYLFFFFLCPLRFLWRWPYAILVKLRQSIMIFWRSLLSISITCGQSQRQREAKSKGIQNNRKKQKGIANKGE